MIFYHIANSLHKIYLKTNEWDIFYKMRVDRPVIFQ